MLIKDIPRPRGFRILNTQLLNSLNSEFSINTQYSILKILSNYSQYLENSKERIFEFSYKVNIKTRIQSTEAAPDTEEAEEKDPGLFSQAQGLVICIKQIKF